MTTISEPSNLWYAIPHLDRGSDHQPQNSATWLMSVRHCGYLRRTFPAVVSRRPLKRKDLDFSRDSFSDCALVWLSRGAFVKFVCSSMSRAQSTLLTRFIKFISTIRRVSYRNQILCLGLTTASLDIQRVRLHEQIDSGCRIQPRIDSSSQYLLAHHEPKSKP